MNYSDILQTFALYGFRKTSMEDIAKAANRSRQAIYNRFGSKEAVLQWAVEAITLESQTLALKALEQEDSRLSERLSRAFAGWAGRHVSTFRNTPHGGELIAAAKSHLSEDAAQAEDRFIQTLIETLSSDPMVQGKAEATDMAMTLMYATKGLLMTAETPEAFDTCMEQVIRTVLKS